MAASKTTSEQLLSNTHKIYRISQRSTVAEFKTNSNSPANGPHLLKYYKHPSIEKTYVLAPPELVLEEEHAPEPEYRTVGVQTMCRESETQTDAYSPAYSVKEGEDPEILHLAKLGLGGDALGVGRPSAEALEAIDRMREKVQFDQSLPTISDSKTYEKFLRMHVAQEAKDRAYREKHIQAEQELHLQQFERELVAWDEGKQAYNQERVEEMMQDKIAQRDFYRAKIEKGREKVARRISLMRNREHIEGKLHRRSIVDDYANYGHKVYTSGRIASRTYHPFDEYGNGASLEGLQAVQQLLPTDAQVDAQKMGEATLSELDRTRRKSLQHTQQLDAVERSIRGQDNAADKIPTEALFQKIERPPPRPPTPSVIPIEGEEQRLAIIRLQALLRGRAIQNLMFEGTQRRHELLDELRLAIEPAAGEPPRSNEAEEQREEQRNEIFREYRVQSTLEQLQARTLATALDFFAKQKVREAEERRIHDLVKHAQKERRVREAEEAGRRQKERWARAQRREHFEQIVAANEITVNSYLNQILSSILTTSSHNQAAHEMVVKQQILDPLTALLEEQNDSGDSIVRSFVQKLLFPTVEHEFQSKTDREDNEKFGKAVNDVLGDFLLQARR